MSPPLPRVRIPARTREKVEHMCAQYAANLAAVILRDVEKQLTDELHAATKKPAAEVLGNGLSFAKPVVG